MKIKIFILALIAISIFSCKPVQNKTVAVNNENKQPVSHVMTKEAQSKLNPDQVMQEFIEGNKRFQNGTITERDHNSQARKSADGQYPKAVVLSCLDSRVPVEDIFDQGIGDVFVARIAGNFANEDMLGSMEFACKVAGAKLILVMGHEHCGAVKGAIDDVKLGNITNMLAKVKPAVTMSQEYSGAKTSKNEEFVKLVSENNVRYTMQQIRDNSPILREMESKGEIKIKGAYYNLADGKLELVN